MVLTVSKESFTPTSGYLVQTEMGTVVDRENFSVEIDSVDPLDPEVFELRLVIGRRSTASQSLIKCSVDDMRLRLVQELVHILRPDCQKPQ